MGTGRTTMRNTYVAIFLGIGLLLAFATGRIVPSVANGQPESDPKNAVDKLTELQAEIKKLQGLVPDQAAIMTHVGYHWSNLWHAIEKENWSLADFYLAETRANLKWAVRAKPFRKTASGVVNLGGIAEAIDNTDFSQMKEAISKKDKDQCIKLYDRTLQGCYACHKASEKPYLVPQRPRDAEVRVINFDPKATLP
jgi:hypothetical protein